MALDICLIQDALVGKRVVVSTGKAPHKTQEVDLSFGVFILPYLASAHSYDKVYEQICTDLRIAEETRSLQRAPDSARVAELNLHALRTAEALIRENYLTPQQA